MSYDITGDSLSHFKNRFIDNIEFLSEDQIGLSFLSEKIYKFLLIINKNINNYFHLLPFELIRIISNFIKHPKKKKLILFAAADCCSHSWFELSDKSFSILFGKKILDINFDHNCNLILPYSNRDAYDKNFLVTILCSDHTEFKFFLRNSSNGYYSGYLCLSII